jgi:hypothetical protein
MPVSGAGYAIPELPCGTATVAVGPVAVAGCVAPSGGEVASDTGADATTVFVAGIVVDAARGEHEYIEIITRLIMNKHMMRFVIEFPSCIECS